MAVLIALKKRAIKTCFFSDQLQELRKVKLGGIICANMDYIRAVQPDAMFRIDPYL